MDLYLHSEADPLIDAAVSHALLERAAQEDRGALRIWRPQATALSLGRLDVRDRRSSGIAAIAHDARASVVRRLAGGRAAVVDSGCLCIGFAQPAASIEESSVRYQLMADIVIDALLELGVQASLGERPGEWCPGAWSVHGPAGKLAGIAQRLSRGAAWCEALIVLERQPAAHSLGCRIHELLGIPWRDEAQGELQSAVSEESNLHARLHDALVRGSRSRWTALEKRPLPDAIHTRSVQLRAGHRWP